MLAKAFVLSMKRTAQHRMLGSHARWYAYSGFITDVVLVAWMGMGCCHCIQHLMLQHLCCCVLQRSAVAPKEGWQAGTYFPCNVWRLC